MSTPQPHTSGLGEGVCDGSNWTHSEDRQDNAHEEICKKEDDLLFDDIELEYGHQAAIGSVVSGTALLSFCLSL